MLGYNVPVLKTVATPSNPPSGFMSAYFKSDGKLYCLNSSGVEVAISNNNKRISTEASSATPTINTDNVDVHKITALAADITSMTTNLSGTPLDRQMLAITIIPTATRQITRGSGFESSSKDLPTEVTTRTDFIFLWNTVTSKRRLLDYK